MAKRERLQPGKIQSSPDLEGRMKSEKNSSGWILVAVALSLVVLCGFVALAIDVGGFYSVRASAQRAADAGALAGALTFVTSCQQTSCTDATRKTIAEQHATGVALANKVMGTAVQQATAVANVSVRQVTVTVTHPAPIFFASVLGFASPAISATATAEASPNSVASPCTKPLFLPNNIHSSNPCDACTSTNPTVLIDGTGNVTTYGSSSIPLYTSINMKGATESLKSPPAGKINLFAVTFNNDTQSGNSVYGQNISSCTDGSRIVCNNTYAVKNDPGLNSATQTQFTNLVNSSSTDTWFGIGQYKGADGNIYNTSHQLITIPIFDVCGIPHFCDNDALGRPQAMLSDPAQRIRVVGFARMFAYILPSGQVRLYLDGISGCSNYVPDPANNPTGPYGIQVRLVHN
jgi:Flp pilus assembly protein TadG